MYYYFFTNQENETIYNFCLFIEAGGEFFAPTPALKAITPSLILFCLLESFHAPQFPAAAPATP